MEARFLITTAEKRSWKNDQPVLFLGEWCKLYSNKSEWKKLDAVTLSYHWDDRRKLYKDYQYLQNVYENFLKQLADELNQFHGTNNSVRYWRVVIGPWLNLFVQMLFDRWELVRDACSNYKISGTSVLRFNDNEMTPQGMEDFHFYYQEDEWNHYIFSKIIEKQHRSCIEELDVYDDVVYEQIDKRPVQPGAREALKNGLASVLDYLSKNADVFIISSYFDRAEQWKLEAMLGQIPTFRKSPELPKFEIGVRDGFTLSDNQKTDFEGFLASILPIQLPVIYLEGYKNIRERALTCNWPSNPKVIYTAVSHSSDEFFKVWAAEKIENGAKLVIGQHGGHYGVGLFNIDEDHECAISTYFTWGWLKKGRPNIVALPANKLVSINKKLKSSQSPYGDLLLVVAGIPRYSYHLWSAPIASQISLYEEDQISFAEHLSDDVSNHLRVRLYHYEFGWAQQERWNARLPEVTIDSSNVFSMYSSVRQSRLVVATYNATTFLETMAADIPTVIFWNPAYWELDEVSETYFKELQEAGIFHDSYQSAAAHVNKIWNDVEGWWAQSEIQRIRHKFCGRYAKVSPDWSEQWVNQFRMLAK